MFRTSVSCRISFHSEIYWAVRKWQIVNKRELSEASCSILNSVLPLIVAYYFNMYRQETKLKGLSESRFGSVILLLRLAGIPFKMKKISATYDIYMKTVIICSCSMITGMFVDVYIHRDDLGRTMTTMRALIPFTNVMWIFSICRYVKHWVWDLQYHKCDKTIIPNILQKLWLERNAV
jgi:hypothetical protein